MNNSSLIEFLMKAKKAGYAAGEKNIIKENDGSYSTRFELGDLKFHDSWFGGEPFGGREVVFYNKKPYWMMVYYGSDTGEAKDTIPVLRKALILIPQELPLRGPEQFIDGDYKYTNIWKGTIKRFVGIEIIYYKGKKVYTANYAGGLVDQREDSE